MRQIHVSRRLLALDQWKGKPPSDEHCDEFIREPFMLYEDGVLKMVYMPLMERLTELRAALDAAPFSARGRTGGLKTRSATFGSLPRHSLFHDYCKISAWEQQDPRGHAVVCAHAKLVASCYRNSAPELYAQHMETSRTNVRSNWLLGDTPFTSGIANDTTPLAYHFDSGNFAGVWSGMITLKDGVRGGNLSLPEYGLCVGLADRSLLMFDGQGLLHGVTPIYRTRPNGRRYTVVYYSMQQMWHCLAPGEELDRVRKKRDQMESRRSKDPAMREQQARNAASVEGVRYGKLGGWAGAADKINNIANTLKKPSDR